jgi:hypothetical protein
MRVSFALRRWELRAQFLLSGVLGKMRRGRITFSTARPGLRHQGETAADDAAGAIACVCDHAHI